MKTIDNLKNNLLDLRLKLENHELYSSISSVDDLKVFMSHHVFSVWDFMNLLKTLQKALTCTEIPWKPVSHTENARLINEIVLEEESDSIDGVHTSHYAFYVSALKELDPHHTAIDTFLARLHAGDSYQELIALQEIPASVKPFLQSTVSFLEGPIVGVAAAFTFGRESIIPPMFQRLVDNPALSAEPKIKKFLDYLLRHIELDGGHHSLLAQRMVANLCRSSEDWIIAENTARLSLEARIVLWDGILDALNTKSIVP